MVRFKVSLCRVRACGRCLGLEKSSSCMRASHTPQSSQVRDTRGGQYHRQDEQESNPASGCIYAPRTGRTRDVVSAKRVRTLRTYRTCKYESVRITQRIRRRCAAERATKRKSTECCPLQRICTTGEVTPSTKYMTLYQRTGTFGRKCYGRK